MSQRGDPPIHTAYDPLPTNEIGMTQPLDHIHFVTGKLAEHAVREQVEQMAKRVPFEFTIDVLPITVAALMTPKWLFRNYEIAPTAARVILPGSLAPHLNEIIDHYGTRIECGPRDIRDLPAFFGEKRKNRDGYGKSSIEIIAEINHAPRLTLQELSVVAMRYSQDGADVIDLGCSPGYQWSQVADAIHCLRDLGMRVSIDSFDPVEVSHACSAGAELVLSVNSTNRDAAVDWGCEVVAIPDVPDDKKSFCETIDFLSKRNIPFRLDPILEPIGLGFFDSLLRFADCKKENPDARMMMGIGNITELTDADSAGINVLLLGICQELQVESVLTTEVINWARSSVRECHLARQMMHFAIAHRVPPKHLEPNLVLLRDERVNQYSPAAIASMEAAIRDRNVRILNADGEIHALSAGVHARSHDPFEVMQQLLSSEMGATINPSHAFYLGYEMAKAHTANTLGKQYEQDQSLNWGFLTQLESHHRLKRD